MIQVEGIQKGRGIPKITVVKIVIKDMSIKEVIESMNLDRIKCQENALLLWIYSQS